MAGETTKPSESAAATGVGLMVHVVTARASTLVQRRMRLKAHEG
jgi:hypothetical protein